MTTPLAPDASANTQSLVEHSPSTVIALKVSRADSVSARCSSAGGTRASVVRKPSIVAMFGSIIPEPFAVPPTTNEPRAVSTRTECSFGNGSVVMMARDPFPKRSEEHTSELQSQSNLVCRLLLEKKKKKKKYETRKKNKQ